MTDIKPLERQIRILQLLSLGRELTVEGLFEYFERGINRRSLQRDLIALTAANVPLNEQRGAHGQIFWSIKSNYLKFIPMTLALNELIASVLLEKLGNIFVKTPIETDIKNLNKKLKQLVTPDVLKIINDPLSTQQCFTTLQQGYIDYSNYGQQLQQYLFAALHQQVCTVVYRAAYSERPKRFTIHPYSLVLFKGAFYGIVYQPKYRTYLHLLIHRIEKLEISQNTFTQNPEFNIDNYLAESVGIWRENPEEVIIQFSPELALKISERIWQKGQQIEHLEDGSIRLKLKVAVSFELVAWILQWGSFAKVVSPHKLIEMVKSEINNLQKKYAKN